jgi:molybdate transport system substrate-binding protein
MAGDPAPRLEILVKTTIRAVVMAAILASFSLVLSFAAQTPAPSGDLRVLISDGMKAVIEADTAQIEYAVGRKLDAQFNSSKNLRDKIRAGEPFDAAILTSDVLDELAKQGKIAAGSRVAISRTGIGIGVRAGAPKPNIGTPEALKQTLVNAKSVSFNPTGASAAPTYRVFAQLGIAEEMKPKLVLDKEAGRPQTNVAEGKVELVISLVPEIKFFPGVDLVGPLPEELQSYVSFGGGVAAHAQNGDAAKALMQYLVSPAVAPVLKAKGMEPQK